nr:glycosyltransferase family 4 protein [Haloferax larsenii]
MRICMLLDAAYPTDIRVAKEARALVDDGHTVFILSRAVDDRPQREEVDGSVVVRRQLANSEVNRGIGGVVRGLVDLVTDVRRVWVDEAGSLVELEGIDVIHVHDLPLANTGLAIGDEYDIPVVLDLHENWPEAVRQYRAGHSPQNFLNPRYVASRLTTPIVRLKRIERQAVRRADRVIAVVPEGRDHYIYDCGADASDVFVVSNVVDLDTFDGEADPVPGYEDQFVVSYVGTLGGGHRGLDTVIKAVPHVVDDVPSLRIVIVGDGSDYKRELERLTSDLGLENVVEFTGRVPFDDVPKYVAASDVCLVPHRDNGHTATTIPHKLFQYMAVRKPVIVTNVAPLGRVVDETESGLVVPAGDVVAMADAIQRLSDDPELCDRLGENGREAVETKYNWAVESEHLLDMYRDLERETAPSAQEVASSP